MPTSLTSTSASLNSVIQEIYQVPVGKVAIALNTVITATVNKDVSITLYKETATGDRFTIARKTIEFASLDNYSPKLDKLVLLPGEKLLGNAYVSEERKVRASGFFGLPSYFDPLNSSGSSADISFSVAERS